MRNRDNDVPALWLRAPEDAPISKLPLSRRAERVLCLAGVVTVGDLPDLKLIGLQRYRNVGEVTLAEVARLVEVQCRRFGRSGGARNVGPRDAGPRDATPRRPGAAAPPSVDELFAGLLSWLDPRCRRQVEALPRLLGQERADGVWPTQSALAAAFGISRQRLSKMVVKARLHWSRQPSLKALRSDLRRLLDDAGGALPPVDLASAVVALRGARGPAAEGRRRALAVVRAAVEVESEADPPRYRAYRRSRGVFVALTGRRLGPRRATCANARIPPAIAEPNERREP